MSSRLSFGTFILAKVRINNCRETKRLKQNNTLMRSVNSFVERMTNVLKFGIIGGI